MGHDNSFFATIMGHNISCFFLVGLLSLVSFCEQGSASNALGYKAQTQTSAQLFLNAKVCSDYVVWFLTVMYLEHQY